MRNAIVMAGGKGTRMKSETPKVLHQILNEPMAGLVVNSLKEAGCERIVMITGYQHETVEKALAGQCEFALQEPQLGTGHAVMQAKQLEHETGLTLVASGDCPCVRSETYAKMYEEIGDADMAVLTAVPDDNGAYGRVIRRDDNTVEKIVEFKDASEAEKKVREINTGIYVFKNEALFAGLKLLKNDNAQHEYYLTDLVEILQEMGKNVVAIKCDDWREAEGVNDNKALAEAEAYLKEKINLHWMQEGVTIYDPKNTYIGPYVTFGHDDIVHPNTYLYGHTVVEDYAEIMPGYYGVNAVIHSGKTDF
ncbi:MAG: NTP transferase domain-containing protein [Erysipelotrichaceae bacterium]|nr:NTP transferase domain-containing protein [Erysipelotrichaceae bacterium]